MRHGWHVHRRLRGQRPGESRVAKVPSTPPRFDLGVVEGVRALGIEPTRGHDALPRHDGDDERGDHAHRRPLGARHDPRLPRRARYPPRQPRRALRHPAGTCPRRSSGAATGSRSTSASTTRAPSWRPLDEDRCAPWRRKLRAQRHRVASPICLINAHMNPAHERRRARSCSRICRALHVSLSTDILPEPPEFERTATTVANAYCAPSCAATWTRSRRRSTRPASSGRRPRDAQRRRHDDHRLREGRRGQDLNSGPAAGVIAAAAVAASADRRTSSASTWAARARTSPWCARASRR